MSSNCSLISGVITPSIAFCLSISISIRCAWYSANWSNICFTSMFILSCDCPSPCPADPMTGGGKRRREMLLSVPVRQDYPRRVKFELVFFVLRVILRQVFHRAGNADYLAFQFLRGMVAVAFLVLAAGDVLGGFQAHLRRIAVVDDSRVRRRFRCQLRVLF